jgi:hypothetical protein
MTAKEKLNFVLTEMNGQQVYLAEPYKVVPYNCTYTRNSRIDKPSFAGYYRIPSGKAMAFGNSVEHDSSGYTKFFDTKEEAFKACQEHLKERIK